MIVSVSKDEVKITELSQVNQGDYKVNLCTFILPECFSGLSVTAVFNGIHVPVAGNRCYIPNLENGNCILGVYAYKEENGETELMYSPKPTVFYVDKGSFTTDVNTEDLPKVFDYETYCNMLKEFWEQIINENTLTSFDENALKVDGNPFKNIDLPLTETNYAYIYEDGMCKKKADAEGGFSRITKCPKYLGFRIEDDETRLYLYIGTLNENGEFVFDESYHIDTTASGAVNYLRQSHNRFIETDGEKYFYYKIAEGSKATLIGSDTFPEGESDIIATANVVVKNNGDLRTTTQKYYSVVLPSGCFYAVLTKQGMPTFLKDDIEDDELTTKPIFNVSYQTGVQVVDGEEKPIIQVNRGASCGVIPENVGAALLRLPQTYNLNDLCIYTDKSVKSNAKSGRRRKAKDIGEKVIKDFTFESQKEIFWNDSTRPMTIGRRFYGVPYSSRWVNSHYLGFEVTPETVLNALNDPYSVAYDGGFVDEEVRAKTVSGHTEISTSGGTGYGLVCSAFTNLICGNPYPQSNRGYTFDSNYVLEDTVDMNSGEVLVNKGLSHCVFVDEIYDKGYSLYEAVDPCVAKTTHTCPADKTTYASSKVRTGTLDDYVFSVTNRDVSGYDKLTNEKLKPLLDFENITIANGKVRVWRGNKAVYGSWDKRGKSKDFVGSGIGVTLHDGITSFTLRNPSGIIETIDNVKYPECFKNENYADISAYVTENGTYEISDGNVSEYFRFYDHDTVQLTFDAEGKAVFKNSDGSIADDVEYAYVNVIGYGRGYDDFDYDTINLDEVYRNDKKVYVYDIDANTTIEFDDGAMVIAKGNYYPDLALHPQRIVDIRAAIVSDITTDENPNIESWGKYSCATSPDVVSKYKDAVNIVTEVDGIDKEYEENLVYNANAVNEVVYQMIEYVDNSIAEANSKETAAKVFEEIATVTVTADADGGLPTTILITQDNAGNAFELTDIYCEMLIGLTDESNGKFYIKAGDTSLMGNLNPSLKNNLRKWWFRYDSYGEGNGGFAVAPNTSIATTSVYPNNNVNSVIAQPIPVGETVNINNLEFCITVGTAKTFIEGTTITLWGVRK